MKKLDDTTTRGTNFLSRDALKIYQFNTKYKFGHLASALSFKPVVDRLYQLYDLNPNIKIYLGKPFGASVLYQEWLKRDWILEKDLKDLIGVFRREDQEKLQIPGVEYVSATLGNSLGVAVGKAVTSKEEIVVVLSDGACHMGQTLEAIYLMNKFKIKNIRVIIDWNNWITNSRSYSSEGLKGLLNGLKLSEYFEIIENPKGYGVQEIEMNPSKWHY